MRMSCLLENENRRAPDARYTVASFFLPHIKALERRRSKIVPMRIRCNSQALNTDFESSKLICCVPDSVGISKIFVHEIVKPDYSVFAFGISAKKQTGVKNMQNAKEIEERMRRIETWTCRSKAHEMR
jgi:hypothetical protein